MDNDKHEEIKDAPWQKEGNRIGEITFKRNKVHMYKKMAIKGLAFVLIASLSGGICSYVLVERRLSKVYNPPDNSLYGLGTISQDYPRNNMTRVAQLVGPSIVGITSCPEGFGASSLSPNGSGIIFDSRGYIVTNYHTLANSEKITVKLSNSRVFAAKFVGADPKADIAVIKIDASNLPIAHFGDSSKVQVGQVAMAIGNPMGDEVFGTLTAGVISAVNKRLQVAQTTYRLVETDCTINDGNSGGALCNEYGEVIGIGNHEFSTMMNKDVKGIGYALAINDVNKIIKDIMGLSGDKNIVPESSLNKSPKVSMDIRTEDYLDASKGLQGTVIKDISLEGSASKAGLKQGDIIVEMEKNKVTSINQLDSLLASYTVGQQVTVKYMRGDKLYEAKVTLSNKK